MKDSGIADLLTPKDTPYSLPKDISPKAKPVKPQEEERFRDESPASVRKIEKPPLISPDLPPDFTERYFFSLIKVNISIMNENQLLDKINCQVHRAFINQVINLLNCSCFYFPTMGIV